MIGTIVRRDSSVNGCPHSLLMKYDRAVAWPIGDGAWLPIQLVVQRYMVDELELLN